MNVYEKLNAAREEFHSLELKKTGHNKFAGYYYFELGDFLIPAMKVFKKHGLCAIVSFEKEAARMEIVDVAPTNASGSPVCTSITITSPMGSASLKGCHEVQNIGAVETYQRRYLWVAALEIVEHDALDATTGRDEPAKATKPAQRRAEPKNGVKADYLSQHPPLPQEEKEYLAEMADNIIRDIGEGVSIETVLDKVEETNLEDIHKVYLSALLPAAIVKQLKDASIARHKTPA